MAVNPNLRQLWRRTVTSGGQVASGLNRAPEFQDRAIANTAPLPNLNARRPNAGTNDLADLKNEIAIAETGAPAPKVTAGLARLAPIARDPTVPVAQPPVPVATAPPVDPATTAVNPTQQLPGVPVLRNAGSPSVTAGLSGGGSIATIGAPVVNLPDAQNSPAGLMIRYGAGDPQELFDALRQQGYGEADAYRMAGITPAQAPATPFQAPVESPLTQTPLTTQQKVQWATGDGRENWNRMSDAQKRQLTGLPEDATNAQLYEVFSGSGATKTDAAARAGFVPQDMPVAENPFVTERVKGIIRQYDAALNELNAETTGIVQAQLRRLAEQGGDFGNKAAYSSITRGIQAAGTKALFDNARRITTEREEAISDAILDDRNTNWDRRQQFMDDIKEADPNTWVQLVTMDYEETMRGVGWSDDQIKVGRQSMLVSAANAELEDDWLADGKPKAGVDYADAATKAKMVAAVTPFLDLEANPNAAVEFVNDWIGENVPAPAAGQTAEQAAADQYIYTYSPDVGDAIRAKGLGPDRTAELFDYAASYFAETKPAGNTNAARQAFIAAIDKWLTEKRYKTDTKLYGVAGGDEHAYEEDGNKRRDYAVRIWNDYWASREG